METAADTPENATKKNVPLFVGGFMVTALLVISGAFGLSALEDPDFCGLDPDTGRRQTEDCREPAIDVHNFDYPAVVLE